MDNAPCPRAAGMRGIAWFVVLLAAGGVLGGAACNDHDAGGSHHATADVVAATDPAAPLAGPLTADDAQRLVELKDTSIGHLENGVVGASRDDSIDAAVDGFARLVDLLPRERLPLQNLAIARLLLLNNPRSGPGSAAQAREAAQRLLDFDPQSATAHWIAANVELVPNYRDPAGVSDEARGKAIVLLRRATQLEPDNAVVWYALYEGMFWRQDTKPSDEAKTALGRAYAANPRNIWLLTAWLEVQAKCEDPAVVDTLVAARQILTPIAADAAKRFKADINQFVSQAIEATHRGDWATVQSTTRKILVVARPYEIAKGDAARIVVHPLEYVLREFSREFHDAHPRPEPRWNADTRVTMAMAEDSLPVLAGVEDLRVMDVDLDGLPDLLVLQPGRLVLLTQSQTGERWTETASLVVPAGMRGILAADLDRDFRKIRRTRVHEGDAEAELAASNDTAADPSACHFADPDIVLFGDAGAMVVRNDTRAGAGGPSLVAVANAEMQKLTGVSAGVLVDVEHDSDLDIVLSSQQGITIWGALGKLEYGDISSRSQLPPVDVPVTTMVAVDWDRDADIDIVVAEPTGKAVGLLENLRHTEFCWTPFDAAFQNLSNPSCVALVEADGNVSWDLLSAGGNGVQLLLTATPRSGVVNHVRTERADPQARSGILAWDFDNDGYRDAAAWGTSGLAVYRGAPKGQLVPANIQVDGLAGPIRIVRSADIDRDGDQDLLVATADRLFALVNQGGTGNNWVSLYPVGLSDNRNRCNHHAIGSLAELRSGGWYQAQVVDAPTVHFGLGTDELAEQVRVVWTSGLSQNLVNARGNTAICEPMILKSSCPYVYTMAGDAFHFFSDCLWAAPLGLQTADGGIAPSRSWEYLRIGGERLTPSDGSYWIQLTEELWEAAYFDKVQLLAVDHPADVEIYSNEKVGPADIADFKIHTVRHRRFPRAATDQRGTDLRPKLQRCDGDFAKPFEQRIRQGLTPEHYIELDLGELHNPRQVTLFLTGWIYPTDSSLNVAFHQDPEVDGPRMPSVWVPDVDGQWKETIAHMGYPGGKTKTIAVDLSNAFLASDYRVRIKTTAEIYWDEVFFTVDEPPADLHQVSLPLQSADLFYRGFSGPLPVQENAPRMVDHAVVTRASAWPPMAGRFTRYGPVHELLQEEDDQLAVLGAGDAMTLRFAVPDAPVPHGWKRDFILHSVGWDKDGDPNTMLGQNSEPLPFGAMRSYPFGPDESPPDSAAYREYLWRYQTRQQNPQAFWRHLVLPPEPVGP
ncbi:MAG: CRTAC1 family protein [Planctomycetes bacterium]|nr:CRTAC1 family protein [Planctomycetota bacterium]